MRTFLIWLVACFAAMAIAKGPGGQGETSLVVQIEGKGQIVIQLHTGKAPKTTARVTQLARQGFYDGQRFHKVAKTPRPFLVQIGAPSSRTKPIDDESLNAEGTGTRIPFEDSGFSNDSEGVVGFAALQKDRDSGDCQFYILLGPAKFLDGSYTVFGRVTEGIDVLRKIERGDKVSRVTVRNR